LRGIGETDFVVGGRQSRVVRSIEIDETAKTIGMLRAQHAQDLAAAGLGVGTMTRHAALLLVHGATMMGVCALACIGPLLRVFRVEPTDVLRDDG
jgi:hypothetical protein